MVRNKEETEELKDWNNAADEKIIRLDLKDTKV